MQLTPVTCDHCGASLQIPDNAHFVTCRYCNSQLQITRTDSAVSTQTLQQIGQNTAAMAEDLHAIRRNSELERLDHEWPQRRQGLMTHNKDGSASTPTVAMGVILIVVMGGFGLLWTIVAIAIGSSARGGGYAPAPFSFIASIFPLFGVFFIILSIFLGLKTIANAGKYQDEEQQYQSRRQQLLNSRPTTDDSRSQP